MILKNNKGKLELRKDNGSYVGTIAGAHVRDAALHPDGTHVAVVYENGKCELRKINGHLERTLVGKDAIRVSWTGDDAAIGMGNGRTELRRMNGSLIRTI